MSKDQANVYRYTLKLTGTIKISYPHWPKLKSCFILNCGVKKKVKDLEAIVFLHVHAWIS